MSDKITLYQLTDDMASIEAAIEQYAEANDGLVHPDLDKMLDEYQAAKSDKLDAILAVYRNAKVEAEIQTGKAKAIEAEAKRYRAKAKHQQGVMDSLKAYVDSNLELGEKHKGEIGSIYRQSRTNYVVADLDALPPTYYERQPKQKLINDDMRSDADIPGVEKQAALTLIFK